MRNVNRASCVDNPVLCGAILDFGLDHEMGVFVMPYTNIERRRERARQRYDAKKVHGGRDWGRVSAICPVCSKTRTLSKNSHGITSIDRNDDGRVIKRCRSCSKRKDYAPWFDKEYVRDSLSQRRRALKVRSVEYLGGSCTDCGYVFVGDNPYAFDFHHRNPTEKKFGPASKTYSWEKTREELDKCDLLCAICHRKVHFEEGARNNGQNI